MTLKEKYDANIEFVKQLQKHCSQHRCLSSDIPFTLPKCTLSQCERKITKSEVDYDNFLKIMEYEPVDWSKVPVDTKIYVKNLKNESWEKRHFSHCTPDGKIYAFCDGTTSFTSNSGTWSWNYAKLAEVEDDK